GGVLVLGFNPLSTCGWLKKKRKMPATMKGGNPMLRTVQFACSLPKADADALNAESGRVYTDMLVWHYRVYRKGSGWLPSRASDWKMHWVDLPHCMPTVAMPPNRASTRRARPRELVGMLGWR